MKTLFLLFLLFLLPLANAQIAIQSFNASPGKILPGDKLSLSVNLRNVGTRDITNILVRLDLSQVPFAPLGSSNEQAIDKIRNDDGAVVNFDLIALPNAEPQIYKVPVEISFADVKKISLVSLEVSAKTNIDIVLDSSDIVKVNDKGKVILKFVNTGSGKVKSLKVTLQKNSAYEVLSSNSVYVGEIGTDDFETEEFTIISRTENPSLLFNLDYKDVNNKEFKETKALSLNVYSEQEALQLGLIKQSFNWIFIILFVFVLILIYFYRRMKKKNVN